MELHIYCALTFRTLPQNLPFDVSYSEWIFYLQKGGGYHLDLLIVGVLIIICSIFGLPWFVAATVLSINHVRSLTRESECSAPGEKPQFLGIREQRLTHVLIFLTIGISVKLSFILKLIPMPVLYGVFLYMGVASLNGIQFFDRILLFFMPKKYQPDVPYLRRVKLVRSLFFDNFLLISNNISYYRAASTYSRECNWPLWPAFGSSRTSRRPPFSSPLCWL